MTELIPIILLITIPVCTVALVAISLANQNAAKSVQSVVETNAVLQYTLRRFGDVIATPEINQVDRIQAEVDLSNARRVPQSPWPQSQPLYRPDGMDDLDDVVGDDV